MLPILFSWGPLTIRTMSVFLALGFVAMSFVYWRRSREEHYKEDQLFDGFLLSLFAGAVAARLGFVIINLEGLGLSPINWLDIVTYPGFSGITGLVVATLYLRRYARKNKWDPYEILDFWVTSVAVGAIFIFVGAFFDGTGFGLPTSLPVGVTAPGLLEPHHPVQLYLAGFYALLYFYLSWAEYHYRTFQWYRSGKNTARTGYLTSVFVIASSIFGLVMTFLTPPLWVLGGVDVRSLAALVGVLFGIGLLYVRSGRTLPFSSERRRQKELAQRYQAK